MEQSGGGRVLKCVGGAGSGGACGPGTRHSHGERRIQSGQTWQKAETTREAEPEGLVPSSPLPQGKHR